jgi:hypothetical protein
VKSKTENGRIARIQKSWLRKHSWTSQSSHSVSRSVPQHRTTLGFVVPALFPPILEMSTYVINKGE